MGGLLNSNTVHGHDTISLNDTISSLRKLCGTHTINLNDEFWSKDVNQMAANLHELDCKMQHIEQEMMTLCNNFVINNIQTRNLNTLIQHITNLFRVILKNDKSENSSHHLIISINLLLLIRVFIKYFVEVSSFNQLSLQFSQKDIPIISKFYQTLICILQHFLPDLLHAKYQENEQKINEHEHHNYSAKIQDLYLEITSFILSISSTQLFINPQFNDIYIANTEMHNRHFLLQQLLNLSVNDLTTLNHVLICIISHNHQTNGNNLNADMYTTPDITDTYSSVTTQESLSLGLSDNDMSIGNECDDKNEQNGSNFLMNIGRNIFDLFYNGWSSYFIEYDILHDSPLKEHCVLILLLLTHQKCGMPKNTMYSLMSQLHDGSIEANAQCMRLTFNEYSNHLLLDISFQHLFESILKSLNETVTNKKAFNLDKYSYIIPANNNQQNENEITPNKCRGNISFSTALLLLYTLISNNNKFKEYIFAFTEIDKLILPLLHYINYICYQQIDLRLSSLSHTIYVLLIVLFIFSEDAFFKETAFNQIIYDNDRNKHKHYSVSMHLPNIESKERISWYKKVAILKINNKSKRRNIKTKTEHIECPVSLGNLMFIIIVELFQNNTVNFRDKYIHQNCIGILSNLAPFCVNLHRYASKKFITFTNLFIKKINRKLLLLVESIKNEKEEIIDSIFNDNNYLEILLIANQLLSICRRLIFPDLMPGNKFVVYYLMNIEKDLNTCLKLVHSQCIMDIGCGKNTKFVSLISNLKNELSVVLDTVNYFHDKVRDEANTHGTALDIKVVLNIINKYAYLWNLNTERKIINDTAIRNNKFEYAENEASIEFFLPFIWRLICKHSGIHFLDHRIKIFKV